MIELRNVGSFLFTSRQNALYMSIILLIIPLLMKPLYAQNQVIFFDFQARPPFSGSISSPYKDFDDFITENQTFPINISLFQLKFTNSQYNCSNKADFSLNLTNWSFSPYNLSSNGLIELNMRENCDFHVSNNKSLVLFTSFRLIMQSFSFFSLENNASLILRNCEVWLNYNTSGNNISIFTLRNSAELVLLSTSVIGLIESPLVFEIGAFSKLWLINVIVSGNFAQGLFLNEEDGCFLWFLNCFFNDLNITMNNGSFMEISANSMLLMKNCVFSNNFLIFDEYSRFFYSDNSAVIMIISIIIRNTTFSSIVESNIAIFDFSACSYLVLNQINAISIQSIRKSPFFSIKNMENTTLISLSLMNSSLNLVFSLINITYFLL